MTSVEPLATLHFGRGVEPRKFQSRDQLIEFTRVEMEFWQKLHSRADGQIQVYLKNIVQQFSGALKSLENSESDLSEIVRRLQSLYVRGLPFSDSRAGFLLGINELGGDFLRSMLSVIIWRMEGDQHQSNISPPLGEVGLVMGVLAVEDVPTQSDFKAIDEMYRSWTEKFSAKEKLIDDLEKRYRSVKAVEEPVNYWEGKAQGHRYWVIGSAVTLLVCGIAGCTGLGFLSSKGAYDFRQATGGKADATSYLVFASYMVPSLLLGVALFWLIRILVRIFLTELTLKTDAEERVVLGKTYLSLLLGRGVLDGKKAFEDKDMTIILTQLFRHSGANLFGDDAAPPIPIAALTNPSK